MFVGFVLGVAAGMVFVVIGVAILIFRRVLFRVSTDVQRSLFGERLSSLLRSGAGPETYAAVGGIAIVVGACVVLYSLARWYLAS